MIRLCYEYRTGEDEEGRFVIYRDTEIDASWGMATKLSELPLTVASVPSVKEHLAPRRRRAGK